MALYVKYNTQQQIPGRGEIYAEEFDLCIMYVIAFLVDSKETDVQTGYLNTLSKRATK